MRVAQGSGEGPRPEASHRPRALGAALAAGISLSAAIVLGAAGETDLLRGIVARPLMAYLAMGTAVSAALGAVLGWMHTPAAVAMRRTDRVGLVIGLSIVSVPLGAALTSIGVALPGAFAGEGGAELARVIGSVAMLYTLGLILFGIPAWVIATAVWAVWVTLIGAVVGSDVRR